MHRIISIFFALLFLASCQMDEAYFRYEEIKNGEWETNHSFIFDLDTASVRIGVPYDITLEVTNSTEYPYQNIWFFVFDNFEDPTAFTKKSKEYLLADEQGRWYGSGFASLFQSSLLIQKEVVFTEKRTYRIMIQHGMRDKVLEGIEKIGIKVKPSAKE